MSGFEHMTDDQVARVWSRLYERIGPGWDWPTLRVCRPALCNSIRRVHGEIKRRAQANGQFFGIPAA